MNAFIIIPAEIETNLGRRAAAGMDVATFVQEIVTECLTQEEPGEAARLSSPTEFVKRLDSWNSLHPVLDDDLPEMKNAMEWESGRLILEGRFDLELFIGRTGNPEGPELPLPHSWYSIGFARVASLARVPMSLMWQYYNGDETTPPLLEELPYDGDRTFVEGFTVNTESHGNTWKRFRIVTHDEVIDVIADGAPIVTRLAIV